MGVRSKSEIHDVIIVGGGPAGLSAALILGRSRRHVLVCDQGEPRNRASEALHGFLSRDEGLTPLDFLKICRDQLKAYPNVRYIPTVVVAVKRLQAGFRVRLKDGRVFQARKLLLATGLIDELPKLTGIRDFFGTSVFHCPYCDGWERRDRPLAVYGKGKRGYKLALSLLAWSPHVTLLTSGPARISAQDRATLRRNGIEIREEVIERLAGQNQRLQEIVFKNGAPLACEALFFNTGSYPHSRLAEKLGCRFDRNGGIKTGKYEATGVPGLFAAGNILKDVQLAIVAAAEGVNAAFGINTALQKEKNK
jgi:thioredoxin reductase